MSSIGIKRPPSSLSDRESQIIINPAHIAHAEYNPADEAEVHGRPITVPQTLTLHFAGAEPLKLHGAQAEEVWEELKGTLPEHMRRLLESSTDSIFPTQQQSR